MVTTRRDYSAEALRATKTVLIELSRFLANSGIMSSW